MNEIAECFFLKLPILRENPGFVVYFRLLNDDKNVVVVLARIPMSNEADSPVILVPNFVNLGLNKNSLT